MMSKALDDFVCWQARRLVGIGYGVALSLRDFMGQEAWQFTIYMKTYCVGCLLTQQTFDLGHPVEEIAGMERQLRRRLEQEHEDQERIRQTAEDRLWRR